MPVRCTEDQDLVGEKDERGKALSANVERSAGKLSQFPSYPLDIDRTTYIAGWHAHHHHQLVYTVLKTTLFFIITSKMPMRCTEHQDALYEQFILWEKRMNEGRPYLQIWRGTTRNMSTSDLLSVTLKELAIDL